MEYPFNKVCILIFIISFIVYIFSSYGGVRTVDNEVQMRVAQRLAYHGTFSLDKPLESWPGFGTTEGKDGKLYPIFGPLQPIVVVPLVWLSYWINFTKWYESVPSIIPLNYPYTNDRQAVDKFQQGDNQQLLEVFAQRFIITILYNPLVTALCNVLMFSIGYIIFKNFILAFLCSILYGFGTIAWSYAGTFFSEPLSNLGIIASFYFLIKHFELEKSNIEKKSYNLALAGLSLGLGFLAHITAILFLPFYLWIIYNYDKKRFYNTSIAFLLGFAPCALFFFTYNFIRFGNIFETGRTIPTVQEKFQYGHFVWPFVGLTGILTSGGKGLLWYSPAAFLGLCLSGYFIKKYPQIGIPLMWALIFRIIFIASRSDWHAGFCLGPRYLVGILPFSILLFTYAFSKLIKNNFFSIKTFLSILIINALIIYQFYLMIIDIFIFYSIIRQQFLGPPPNLFALTPESFYTLWITSPLDKVFQTPCAPFILRALKIPNILSFTIGSVFIVAFISTLLFLILRNKKLQQNIY